MNSRTPNTKQTGDLSVARIVARLVELERVVSIPFGDNARYDLIVEIDDRLLRVQCKTGRLEGGAIVFPVSSSAAHRGGGRRSYHGEVDAFAVHSPDTAQVLVVPSKQSRIAARRHGFACTNPSTGSGAASVQPLPTFSDRSAAPADLTGLDRIDIIRGCSPIAQLVERRTVNLMAAHTGNRVVNTPLIRGTLRRKLRQSRASRPRSLTRAGHV